ncbi:MAG: peptide deformylase [Candidatus Doudnabacteria bacterium RIFCSPLOWO2_02_FULL_42_9]|uniref:Peptide deformylase n=1 Tax=Candidatus Doudnabacteria bacterium RIFCSPHIGHO2_01_FULL_41_86 TaxID=1817821 RepID=A0A1F5N853_9BACT|nr:MAG: peptide deformylase [Candidatus Doudnabacteria bacterium RIFCSPHIGHO2_01_FULL_41_86]OGE75880.1 MAG: peptide deformylase [Candidatus Doudnabacteria bacterium RIFCSPHIGHO2_01_43_10]OGE86254.1 MAG: peptide deformylase [Candidatus Doudnabacteria bacterium RIFCSPHIGHO2_12_FULL_42_22]OGE87102.1 MAG: peptide deformylase [Candidatus Doudnabacteria bacterium RIFCSPHIGHO2_02_FULL_42_25]OGE92242.1 MAG: peptide deformylase [Candidatus Doudnabacteria bacterium RIFCSPLOWO2_01_FULL_42_60]OGF00747.1 M
MKIVTIPNPILYKKTELIKKFDRSLADLVEKMIETCRAANGIGLAAPQIGKSIRLCVINLEHMGMPPFALVNPKITKKSWRKIEMEEGCLSIPGIYGIVKRPAKITVEALNLEGEKSKFEADGLLARVIQHEVDHLDGILFTSKIIKETSGKPDEKM